MMHSLTALAVLVVLSSSLDKSAIRAVFKKNSKQIRGCYETALERAPNLSGKLAVRLSVLPAGAVDSAEVASSTLGDAELERCVLDQVRTFKFPAFGGGEKVFITYPFIFNSSPPDAGTPG